MLYERVRVSALVRNLGWSYRHSRARNARGSRCICTCCTHASARECQGVRPAVLRPDRPRVPVYLVCLCRPANGCRPSNTYGGDLLTWVQTPKYLWWRPTHFSGESPRRRRREEWHVDCRRRTGHSARLSSAIRSLSRVTVGPPVEADPDTGILVLCPRPDGKNGPTLLLIHVYYI